MVRSASPGIKIALMCRCCGSEFVSLTGDPVHVLRVWGVSCRPFAAATCNRGGELHEHWWHWDGEQVGKALTEEEVQQLKVSVVLDAI